MGMAVIQEVSLLWMFQYTQQFCANGTLKKEAIFWIKYNISGILDRTP